MRQSQPVGCGRLLSAIMLCALLPGILAPAAAEIFEGRPDNYVALVRVLSAGDELRLVPGEYTQGLSIRQLMGASGAPIVITGPSTGAPALFLAQSGRNTISIVNSAHVIIKNLVLEGQGLAVDGVKCEGHADWAHHITLENLTIRGYGNKQQTVGISTKCPAWNWVIRHNVIEAAGTGMYFGNSDGRAPFIAGLIEHNLIVDSIGYNLQVKHQLPRPELPGMPREKSATIIRHNVFSKAQGGSKDMARPNVLVGHWPLSGSGQDDRYVIYGNLFYQNPHEALFQGEGNIALYNNLFVNHAGDAVRIQPHNDTPRIISVFYNTVVAAKNGIVLLRREGDPEYEQLLAGNAVFGRPALSVPAEALSANVAEHYEAAARFLNAPFAPLEKLDLYPLSGRLKITQKTRMDARALNTYEAWDRDFNGNSRKDAYVGAYAGEGRNPGWPLSRKRKP